MNCQKLKSAFNKFNQRGERPVHSENYYEVEEDTNNNKRMGGWKSMKLKADLLKRSAILTNHQVE